MERTRSWRRYKSECYYLKRIKRKTFKNYIYMFWSTYSLKVFDATWMDKISSPDIWIYRSVRTTKWESRVKVKWGKKGKRSFDWSADPNTRPKDKARFLKELREYGY